MLLPLTSNACASADELLVQGGEVCDPCTMSVVMKPQQEALMAKMAQFPHHMQAAMVPVNSSIAAIAEVLPPPAAPITQLTQGLRFACCR